MMKKRGLGFIRLAALMAIFVCSISFVHVMSASSSWRNAESELSFYVYELMSDRAKKVESELRLIRPFNEIGRIYSAMYFLNVAVDEAELGIRSLDEAKWSIPLRFRF